MSPAEKEQLGLEGGLLSVYLRVAHELPGACGSLEVCVKRQCPWRFTPPPPPRHRTAPHPRPSMQAFEKVKVLGHGSFGEAILVQTRARPARRFVIKRIKLHSMSSGDRADALKEAQVSQQLLRRKAAHHHWIQEI